MTAEFSTTLRKSPASQWKGPLQIGLLGGIVAVAISLEGMIQAFSGRSPVRAGREPCHLDQPGAIVAHLLGHWIHCR